MTANAHPAVRGSGSSCRCARAVAAAAVVVVVVVAAAADCESSLAALAALRRRRGDDGGGDNRRQSALVAAPLRLDDVGPIAVRERERAAGQRVSLLVNKRPSSVATFLSASHV